VPVGAIIAIVVAAVLVFAIAAGAIGREAHRLDAFAPRTVYELEEATQFVADRLPTQSQARLTHDEVRQLLRAHLRWLHGKGLQPADVIEHVQDIDRPVVIDEDSAVGYLISVAEAEHIEVDDIELANVTEAHLEYLDEIGAIGPPAEDAEVLPQLPPAPEGPPELSSGR
jgi:hypothetical protein